MYTHRNFGQLGAKSPVYIQYLRWPCKRTPNKCPHLRREHRGGAHLICRWPSASPEHIAAKWASGRRPLQPHRRTPGGCAIRVKSGIVRGWYSDLPYRNKLWFKRWRHLHSGDVSAAALMLNWAPTQRPGWIMPPPLGAPRLSNREQQPLCSFILRTGRSRFGSARDRKRVVAFQLLHKNKESGDVIYYEVSAAAYFSQKRILQ